MPFYLTPEQDDYNQIPELQVCLAEALFDIEGILADPTALPEQELVRLQAQIVNDLEREWELTGSGEDELASMMVQISQVAAREFSRDAPERR